MLEAKEQLEPALLDEVSKALNVPAQAIQNLDDDGAINIIATTFNSNDNSFATKCTFNINPIEKWVEAVEENKKLYERLLSAEKEKVELLKRFLDNKQL